MFIAGTLRKLKVSAVNLFLEKRQLVKKGMKKNVKLVLISACLAKAQLDKATTMIPMVRTTMTVTTMSMMAA